MQVKIKTKHNNLNNNNMKTIEDVKKEVAVLTADEQQLLKDTIIKGSWGDTEYDFLVDKEGDEIETDWSYGFCTNDAKKAGHFSGRKVSAMFRGIYRKMCQANGNRIGHIISHCNDWWGDGNGDMLFIRDGWDEAFEKWAREK